MIVPSNDYRGVPIFKTCLQVLVIDASQFAEASTIASLHILVEYMSCEHDVRLVTIILVVLLHISTRKTERILFYETKGRNVT